MRWLKIILGVALLMLLGWWLKERFFISEETRIKRAIAAAEQAVEAGNLLKLEGFIAQDYTDHYGFDKSTVLAGIRQFRAQYPKIFIHITGMTITLADDRQTAQTAFIARILTGPVDDPSATEVRNERLRLHLRKTDSGWKLRRAEAPELKFE